MNRRGVTLVELLAGLATALIIGAVSASLLKAGIKTYTYSVRQNEALTRARKALGNEGAASGVLRGSRKANAVSALNAAQVSVESSTSVITTSYYVGGAGLYRSIAGTPELQAESITQMEVKYYNLNGSGLIIESTSAASAVLVTAQVTIPGKTSKDRSYHLFSGTLLKNHP